MQDLQRHSIFEERQNNSSGAFIMHLNINGLQNKYDELKLLNDTLKPHIIVNISETKIDRSYPNSQFNIPGCYMYRKYRKKGGGGLMVYFSSTLSSRKLTLPKTYSTLEAIAVESKIGRNDMLFLSIYRPPKQKNTSGTNYQQKLEEEINDICQRACFQKQSVIIIGDLNMDRMEGKILKDLEEVNDLECTREPTRITPYSASLLDVILTNKLELFKKCGTYDPAMSDHCMIYGEMSEKIQKHRPKTITFRQMKNTNFELLNRDLSYAPWHVKHIFTDIDDKYDCWKGLVDSVVDDHAPITKIRVREKDIPYMTPEWKQAIRNKKKYAVQFSKNRTCT